MKELEEFETVDIADALVKLDILGYLPNIHSQSPEKSVRLFGPVYTIQMVDAKDPRPALSGQHPLDNALKDHIVLTSCPPDAINAIWGGLMTERAKFLGVKGIVTNGKCRDIKELHEQNFPVYASGLSCLGAKPFLKAIGTQVPLSFDTAIGQVQVQPGDYLMADENGVVIMPKDRLNEIYEVCKKQKEVDEKCLQALRNGKSLFDAFATYRTK